MREKRRVFLATVSKSWRKQVQEKLFLFIISSARKCACAWDIDDGKTRPAECVSLYSLRDRQFSLSSIYSWILRPPRTHAHKLIDLLPTGRFLFAFSVVTSCLPLQPMKCLAFYWTGDFWWGYWQFSVAARKFRSWRRENNWNRRAPDRTVDPISEPINISATPFTPLDISKI